MTRPSAAARSSCNDWRLNERARAHPAYRRVSTLLNQTFRKASVAQRLATLQAAEWLIDVLENLTPFL